MVNKEEQRQEELLASEKTTEQLSEEQPVEATEEAVEETETEEVEEAAEEVAEGEEDAAEDTETVEETAPEATAEVEEDAEAEAEATESADALSAEMKQTEKELFVVKEMREELAVLYARNKELENEKEQLNKELETLKSELETNAEQLERYVTAEKAFEAKKRQERVEALSKKFEQLGQSKTAEQLSAKDDETLGEYEKIVDAALDKMSESLADKPVTSQSQSAEKLSAEEKTEVASAKPKETKSKPEQLSNEEFFAGLCETLTSHQGTNASSKKVFHY